MKISLPDDGWYLKKGPEYDVAISSRVRLSRNLDNLPFPGMMDAYQEKQVSTTLLTAIKELPEPLRILDDLEPLDRRVLLERNLISQSYVLETERPIIVNPAGNVSIMINEIDHLRIAAIHGGLDLINAFRITDEIDRGLDKKVKYAASIDLGFLNTEMENCGTGLRGSVLLHLPGLVETGLIERSLKAVVQLGLNVRGFLGGEEDSHGDLYQLSNMVNLGENEVEILEKLENVALQLVHYERKARKEMYQRKQIETEDRVFRAYGLLHYAKMVNQNEAVTLLSSLRLGISLGLLDLPMEIATALLFFCQKAHVTKETGFMDRLKENSVIDETRAKIIRDHLFSRRSSEADDV
ncbi:MAG: hypothetical protein KAU17_02260 [Spirochaetales bacterium]|nr:hypothetical protein [Spirochaetales bacterium]